MKKIIAFLLVVSLTAAIAVGGTLAYLTDRDSEANVFTVGNVEIDLDEKFDQGAELIPGVDIEKEATITNTGDNDAWVWMTLAVPAKLDTVGNASKNALHWNVPGAFWEGYNQNASYIQSAIDAGWLPAGSTGVADDKTWNVDDKVAVQKDVEIDGVLYNVYTLLYNSALIPGETTNIGLAKVYLDTHVDIHPDGGMYWVENGATTDLGWNIYNDGNPVIHVSAYAMQTDGFATVEDAYKAYNEQWTTEGGVNNGLEYTKIVGTNEELAEAIADGATNIMLKAGTYNMPAAAKGKTLTINGSEDSIIEVVPAGQGEANGQLDYNLDGSTVTFNGVTIKTNNQTYAGYARLKGTYNNCTFQNQYCLNDDSVFNNCTLNVSGDQYNTWTWGAPNATFNGCTFNSDGKAVLLYGTANTKLTISNCVFNDNGGLTDKKAAIEIGNDYGKSYELIVNNTTVNGYEINDKGINTGTTLWGNKNSMGTDKLNVVVDGVDVY